MRMSGRFLVGVRPGRPVVGRAISVVAFALTVAMAVGCSGSSGTVASDGTVTLGAGGSSEYSVERLAEALEAVGLTVTATDQGSSVDFFENSARTEISASDGSLDIFTFPTAEAATVAAAGVDEHGYGLPTDEGGTMLVAWAGSPHFFLRDRIIVIYLSPLFTENAPSSAIDDLILDTLRSEMGDEFMGG